MRSDLLATLLACGLVLAGPLASASEGDELREQVEAALEDGTGAALEALGRHALPTILDLMVEDGLNAASGSVPGSNVLLDALSTFRPDEVVQELRRRMPGVAEPRTCSLYLGLVERYARPTDVELALSMCAALPQEERAPQAQDLERAVTRVLERDPRGVDLLARLLVLAEPDLALALARAAVSSGSPAALGVLAGSLGQRQELDLSLLGLIARAAEHAPRPVAPSDCRAVRSYLVVEDYQLRREAAYAIGMLADFESAELLIEMLTAEVGALRSTALYGLRQMSSLEFGPEPSRWRIWLQAERIWFHKEAGEILELVHRNEVPVILLALDDLRAHRYRRFEVARQVEHLLEHRAESVRARACALHQDLAPELHHPVHDDCSATPATRDEAVVAASPSAD